ncbi:MAG TPA: hypothetical protein VJ859_01670 [Allosphingosinicella sp.]|nr:hypothetical protein [Allosphingosinicella sp.]
MIENEMVAEGGLSIGTGLMFFVGVIGQVVGISLLPRTDGFTDLPWTAVSLGSFIGSLWLLSLIMRQGAPLIVMVPLVSASVPLLTIAVAYFGYGQTPSLAKLAMLIGACAAVGIAAAMS